MKRDRQGTLKETFEDLKQMSWPDRWNHIWTYYYLWIIAFVFLVIMGVEVGKIIHNARLQLLQSGMLVNAELTEEMEAHMTDGLLDYAGLSPKKYKAEIAQQNYTGRTEEDVTAYYTEIGIMARISAEDLDYMLLDQLAYDAFLQGEYFLDLRELADGGTLAEWEDLLLYREEVPIGIRVNETEIGQRFLPEEDYFLLFIQNSPRKEEMQTLLSFFGLLS